MINKLVIIEDEKPNADRLVRLIRTLAPEANILTVLDSIADSVDWFNANPPPDLVMMDIRLSDGLSFDIFSKVAINCPVIFTTAYDEYALQAFRHNGIDYLLKPIETEELEKALNKVRSHSGNPYDTTTMGRLMELLRPKEFRSKFLLPFKDGYKVVPVNEICFISLEHRIATAHLLNSAEAILQHTMEELEQQLDPKLFFRANRQFIIHIDSVKQILNYFNGKLKVILKGNTAEVIVSREKAASLKDWISF
ncbi:response regulator transcription factor [Pedobacter sp. HDW13]|uniref:LytR/AlgR family response regulator transcription factor n=1 Tax=Pedobacter sp. HDW13 TaxID=2714940 RepID=UPI0014084815|nr:LytTR family DNA-binding domain-containing protein [Pedobacter sp. HDW13]QIL40403.1 response regulator transcription factor [Pedobacter sp. HDW13]